MSKPDLTLAILAAKGIITPSEEQALVAALATVIPLDYVAAQSLVAATLTALPPWESCESCRSMMWNYRQALTVHHNHGHPTEVA